MVRGKKTNKFFKSVNDFNDYHYHHFRCSADAVIINAGNQLVIVERGGAQSSFFTTPVHLVTEIDGVRILSSSMHEMIQKVPHVTKEIFGINSTEPGSYLLEASKQYERKSHTSYEYIDLVGSPHVEIDR